MASGFYFNGDDLLLKEILKIIGMGIIIYPISVIYGEMQGTKLPNKWLSYLIIVIVVCTGMILFKIFGKKK